MSFKLVHQPQEAVRAALLGRPGGLAAGVVGLVEDDQVPVLGLEQVVGPVAAAHQVAGAEDERLLVPLVAADLPLARRLRRPWVFRQTSFWPS